MLIDAQSEVKITVDGIINRKACGSMFPVAAIEIAALWNV